MKKLRAIIMALGAIVCVVIIAVCIHLEDEKCIDTVKFVCQVDENVSEKISLFFTDGKYYAFLPSYADFNKTTIEYALGNTLFINDELFENKKNCSELVVGKTYPIKMKSILGTSVLNSELIIMQSHKVSSLSIQLIDGRLSEINNSTDKSVSKTGICSLILPDGTINYYGSFDKLKGRGNSTWNNAKKPYDLSFKDETEILNLGNGIEFCLLANEYDKTNINNKTVLDFAKTVGSFRGWAPACEFVDLYVNDEYIGLYLLTQKINEAPAFSKETINENILFCLNNQARKYNSPTFKLDGKIAVRIVSPKSINENKVDDLHNRLIAFSDALKANNNSIEEYIDVDSWARKYLVEEIFANVDSGLNSQFFVLNNEDNKIYAGPCWDYDLAIGIQRRPWVVVIEPDQLFAIREQGENSSWYYYLCQQSEFNEYTVELFNKEFAPQLTDWIKVEIPLLKNTIYHSVLMNNIRWNEPINSYDDFCKAVDERIAFLNDRLDSFSNEWNNNGITCKNIASENEDIVTNEQEPGIINRIINRVIGNDIKLFSGLSLIAIAIMLFIVIDMYIYIKSRRYKNGKN